MKYKGFNFMTAPGTRTFQIKKECFVKKKTKKNPTNYISNCICPINCLYMCNVSISFYSCEMKSEHPL